jgi:hypothetical protein
LFVTATTDDPSYLAKETDVHIKEFVTLNDDVISVAKDNIINFSLSVFILLSILFLALLA